MEKSKEGQFDQPDRAVEMVDTRPVNGRMANHSNRVAETIVDPDVNQDPYGLVAWISLVVFWIREMLWRRRFWSKLLKGPDDRQGTGQ
jgi:hypothetical protein